MTSTLFGNRIEKFIHFFGSSFYVFFWHTMNSSMSSSGSMYAAILWICKSIPCHHDDFPLHLVAMRSFKQFAVFLFSCQPGRRRARVRGSNADWFQFDCLFWNLFSLWLINIGNPSEKKSQYKSKSFVRNFLFHLFGTETCHQFIANSCKSELQTASILFTLKSLCSYIDHFAKIGRKKNKNTSTQRKEKCYNYERIECGTVYESMVDMYQIPNWTQSLIDDCLPELKGRHSFHLVGTEN